MREKQELHIVSYTNLAKKTGKVAFKYFSFILAAITLLVTCAGLAVVLGGLGMYLTYSAQFSSIAPQSNSTQLVMYDKNGVEFYRGYGAAEPNRVELAKVPRVVINATLAAEDLEFYKHGPIDIKGLGRAIYLNWKETPGGFSSKLSNLFDQNSYSQGGSTITQQLVKNIYLTDERSFDRKIKEATFAYKMEQKYSKDKILELYLNNIYYGEQSLGIKNAAKTFFNKELSQLDLAEASMLAGLPQAPSYYDPLGNNAKEAKLRQEYVLQQMYLAKMISLEEAKAAANEALIYYGQQDTLDKYPFYSQNVKDELVSILGKDNVDNHGLQVYTTLDAGIQELAEAKVKANLVTLAYRGASNAAVVVENPTEKTILALVGGADWTQSKVNVATSERQPGSSFKPIVYATAFDNGYTAATILKDAYVNFGGTPAYTPQNYSGGYAGYITVRNALARSLNIPAVEMGKLAGISNVIDTAHKLGISSINRGSGTYGLSLSLGSAEVKLADMVNVYASFADSGRSSKTTSINKITNTKGESIALPTRPKHQAISAESAYILSGILSDNKARSVTFGTNSPLRTDKTTAVKTGTTDNYTDSWTVGYSPDLVVGVWMGNNDHSAMKKVSGIEGAAYIWHDIITGALANIPDKGFVKPSGITTAWVNPYTGGTATYQGGSNILENFKLGTVPTLARPDLAHLKQF